MASNTNTANSATPTTHPANTEVVVMKSDGNTIQGRITRPYTTGNAGVSIRGKSKFAGSLVYSDHLGPLLVAGYAETVRSTGTLVLIQP